MEDLRVVLGGNIRALRLKRGWTLEELAFHCSVNANYLGDAERGRRNISISSLGRIARGLEVEPADLLKGAGAPAPRRQDVSDDTDRRFLSLVRDSGIAERRVLYRILREAARGLGRGKRKGR